MTNFEKWKKEMTPTEFSKWIWDLFDSWPRETVIKFANAHAEENDK